MTSTGTSVASRNALLMMIQGYIKSRLVCIAAKLDIAECLSHGPKQTQDLSHLLGISAGPLRRLMRGFVTCGLVSCEGDDYFEITPLGEGLRADAPDSVRNLAIRVHDLDFPSWVGLLRSTQCGGTAFESFFGTPFYEYLENNSALEAAFQADLTARAAHDAEAIVKAYDFHGFRTIVDVGGGQGVLLAEILRRYLDVAGILFDSPSVKRLELPFVVEMSNRLRVAEGDFFNSVPRGGDLYILKLVLHNWSDDLCLKILGSCRRSMEGSAKLLIIERLMPDPVGTRDNEPGHDLSMFALVGGAERTCAEFRSLLRQAGFELTHTVATGCPLHIIAADCSSQW